MNSQDAYTPARPRRFQFGLRAMFVLVVIVAIPCAWVGYSVNWIRERKAALESVVMFDAGIGWQDMPNSAPPAPYGLGLFGERGYGWLCIRSRDKADAERIHQLFPEAGLLITGDGVVVYRPSVERAMNPETTGFSNLNFTRQVTGSLPMAIHD